MLENNTMDAFSGNFVKGVLDNPIYDLFNGAHEQAI